MKKPKVPPREKKNSKYKIDEALRYAKKNKNVRVFITIQDKKKFFMILDYIVQKAELYDLENCKNFNKTLVKDEVTLFTNESKSVILIHYVPAERMNVAALNFKETDYVIMDEGYGKITEWNFKFKFDRINFEKFKFAKIDKKRLEEIKNERED